MVKGFLRSFPGMRLLALALTASAQRVGKYELRFSWMWKLSDGLRKLATDMKQCAPRCLYASLSHLDYASRHGAGGEMEGSIHRLRSLPFPTAIPLHYPQEASLARYLNKQTRPYPPPKSETLPQPQRR
ncbi:hypothetical protein E2C01_066248 [Portunus trituberculatus]|uniref:Secreted protein n=1 Tax=Portunus trituberculatus TaxID=210409 RepID=A0A5B7HPR9_PORTR|nr:hypothetical protein [Portunus trituberculatus]